MNANESIVRDVRLEATVCAASDPAIGVVILQDETDTELLELGGGVPELSPGDKIQIIRNKCLLRRRDMGIQISPAPTLDLNGIHAINISRARSGTWLKKGRHALALEWFNHTHPPGLELQWQAPGSTLTNIPYTNLFCSVPDEGFIRPGLLAECYLGDWERVPDFDVLEPVKAAVVTNFDLSLRTRDKWVGMRFRGFLDVPDDGIYDFELKSADGSLLFIDDSSVSVVPVGKDPVPTPAAARINEWGAQPTRQHWVTVEGRVGSVAGAGRGVELELYSQHNSLRVRVADAQGLAKADLLNAEIRVTGVGVGLFNLPGKVMLGQVFAANSRGVEMIHPAKASKADLIPLGKADQVQTLSLEDARGHQPVHLRGVVTSKGGPYDFWVSVQDDTRGIFVDFHNASNSVPMAGDFYEIIGRSGAGDFAPVVLADQLVRLGKGELPMPLRPTWDELNNGSMDVQWVEFRGLVTALHSNTVTMLLPSGQIDVQIEGPAQSELAGLSKAVVRIRGVLFAVWNAAREVRLGSILMRNASIAVEIPAPSDPFNAVLKTPRDLLLFDAQATAFRRVKVRGEIIYCDSTQCFLQQDGKGLRLLPADKGNFKPGDIVEAVGYPDISRTDVQLRQVTLRKTGEGSLPPAVNLSASLADADGMASTRVRIEGELLGWHFEQGNPVLEMQSDTHLYLARLARYDSLPFRVGSELGMQGVYVSHGRSAEAGRESFELLVNSPEDIAVLSQPPWWTLERLLILIGILAGILVFSAVWITQLRRLVEQRTAQLRRETQERELVERERALEVERSRIARDLHDDLGASLTEIAVLASKGQRTGSGEHGIGTLFRAITSKARELVAALDIIVWAVDPKDNSLQSVADYLCDFTDEYLSPSGIACRFDVPVTLPAVVLEGRARHDLFLAVKETLNNIVRHAEATEVEFRLIVTDGQLEIVLGDNGKGFDAGASAGGKGLKSLPHRLSDMGGRYEVKSAAGTGTVVTIVLPLALLKRNGRMEQTLI